MLQMLHLKWIKDRKWFGIKIPVFDQNFFSNQTGHGRIERKTNERWQWLSGLSVVNLKYRVDCNFSRSLLIDLDWNIMAVSVPYFFIPRLLIRMICRQCLWFYVNIISLDFMQHIVTVHISGPSYHFAALVTPLQHCPVLATQSQEAPIAQPWYQFVVKVIGGC